jgi:hypothetical protein
MAATAAAAAASSAAAKAVDAINKALADAPIAADEADALLVAIEASTRGEATALLPHVRVRALTALPAVVAGNEGLAGKALLALVNTLSVSGEDAATDALRRGAIDALTGVAARAKSKLVDITREVTDVLLQVSLPDSGFDAALQRAARERVTGQLAQVCPLGVVSKLLHWLSDDREDDSAAQIEAERELALSILETTPSLMRAPAVDAIRADEALPKIAARVLTAVSAAQYQRLVPIIAGLIFAPATSASPSAFAASADGAAAPAAAASTATADAAVSALVDAVTGAKHDTPRSWESLAALTRVLPKSFRSDGALDKLVALLGAKKGLLDGAAADAVPALRALVVAAQLATNDGAAKRAVAVRDMLLSKALASPDAAANYSLVEAALLALAALVRDEETAKSVDDDATARALQQLATDGSETLDKLVFAIKKEGRSNVRPVFLTAVMALQNIKAVAAKLGERQPTGATPPASWLGLFRPLPSAAGARGAFQRAVETAAAASVRPRE